MRDSLDIELPNPLATTCTICLLYYCNRAPKEILAQLDPREIVDLRAPKDQKDPLDLMEMMAPRDTSAHLVLLDHPEMAARVHFSTEAGMILTTSRRLRR